MRGIIITILIGAAITLTILTVPFWGEWIDQAVTALMISMMHKKTTAWIMMITILAACGIGSYKLAKWRSR